MKKRIFLVILLILILFSMLGSVDAKSKLNSAIEENKYNVEKGNEIIINFGYADLKNEINVYKATLEYNENVFEEVNENDFKTLNNWTKLRYNKNTKEFIVINPNNSKQSENVIQVNFKVKNEIDTKETNIGLKDIVVSDGNKDININETHFKLNIVENDVDKGEEQNPSDKTENKEESTEQKPEQDKEENTEQKPEQDKKENTEQKPDKENKNELNQNEEKENLAPGTLPKTGQRKINIIILSIILIISLLIIVIKYKKISKKSLKLFITILAITFLSMQPFIENYATNITDNIKGNLNDDLVVDYEDVNLLQLHLIHTHTLPDDKINNADLNDDGKINVTDLSILIKNIEDKKAEEDDNSKKDEENNKEEQEEIVADIDYSETLENIQNPERGFYTPIYIEMKQKNNTAKSPKNNLVHLRIGIGDFSGKVNQEKQDKEFTEDMLNALNKTLENIKKNNGNVIIRFAYDNFEGIKDLEPNLEMILTHIEQLKPIFEKNKDVISYVELGFFGPWGEMHSSSICTTDNVSKAIDAMLKATPETMKIGVRTPGYYTAWKKIDRNELDKDVNEKGADSYRIGLYNDGYLGSESDLGTFKNREIEISWLEKQALHTMYGGEVVANNATGQPLNTTEYISTEGFRTHTTYLNSLWNNNVIDNWKNEIYNGEDTLYKGQTGYLYIENHLGYRFVLRKSKITTKIDETGKYKVNLEVENVGFGNVVNDKKVTIVLEKDGVFHEIDTNIDVTTWNSKEITNINIENTLPKGIKQGNWKVYLRISKYGDLTTDNNYNCIRFANNNTWNEEIGANYIGTMQVLSEITKTEYKDTTSMYSWGNQTLVKDADVIYKSLEELNVDTLYQSISSSYMKKEYLEEIIKSYTNNGIEVHRLIGDSSWAYDSTNAKKKIDEINEYNKSVEENAKIRGVNLDIEPHTDERWDKDHQTAFTQYKNTMIELYNYAKEYNLHVTICTNVWFNKYEGFEELYEKAADTYSIMNYVKTTNISGIKEEVEIAKKYNKKIETIAHSSADSDELESYHNDGIDKLLKDQKAIIENYSYSNLRASYHYFTTIEYLKDKSVYLDLKLKIIDNSEFPEDLILINSNGEEKKGYIVELGNQKYYMFPKLKENDTYKISSNSHEVVGNNTIIIPSSPKGKTSLEINLNRKYDFSQITPIDNKVTYEPIVMANKKMQEYGTTGAGSQWPVSLETSKDGSLMLYGIDVAGVFKSTDHGKTWVRANSGITSTGAGMFAIDPHNTNHVATLGLSQYSSVGGIHISYDQAETWNKTLKIGVKGYRYLWDGLEFDPTSYDQNKGYSTDLYFSTPYKRDTQIRTNVSDYRLLTTLKENEVGLYKSTDGGETFSLVINDAKVADGIIRFTDSGKLFIGNQYGLFLINTETNTIEKEYLEFTNNPNTSNEASTKGVTGLDVVGNVIYVQTWDGIFTIENDKITKITDDTTYDKRWPQFLTVSKSNPNHMVYEFRGNVDNYFTTLVNVTFDGGKTWTIAEANLETTFYYNVNFASREKAFIIDPSDDSNVITFGGDNVFRSSDGGLNFVQANGISNMMQGGKFHFNYYNPDLILLSAQDYKGVVSTDGGKTFTNLIIDKGNFYGGFAADENTFYGFANYNWGGGTLTYTHDGGKTWTDTGLKAKYQSSATFYSSLQSITDPNILFAQEYYSKDKGYTWEEMNGCVVVYTYNYTGEKELYGANKDGKIVVSYDNGDTWNLVTKNKFSSGSISETIYDLAYDHINNYIYAVVREEYDNVKIDSNTGEQIYNYWGIERIYKYNINTNECTRIEIPRDTERGFMRVKTIAVDPKSTSVIYVGCSGDYFSSSVGLVRSIDGGENWKVLTTANNSNYEAWANNQGGYEVSCIAIHPKTGEVWLASGCYGYSKIDSPYNIEQKNN